MIKIENDCCDCATESYPCRGSSCELRNSKHYYCDECGDETDILYEDDCEVQLCSECALNRFKKIEQKGDQKMLEITFRYADAMSNWEWRTQKCTVDSVEECKRIYGLGIDCDYEIVEIKEVKER